MVEINVADAEIFVVVDFCVVDNEINEDGEGGGAPVIDVVVFTVKDVDDVVVDFDDVVVDVGNVVVRGDEVVINVDDVVADVDDVVVDDVVDVAEVDTIVAVVSDTIDDVDNAVGVVVVGGDVSSPVVIITVTATALETDAAANINKTAFRAMANLGESWLFSRNPKLPKRVPKQKLTADHI